MRLVKGYHCLLEFDIADLSLSINHPGKLSDPPPLKQEIAKLDVDKRVQQTIRPHHPPQTSRREAWHNPCTFLVRSITAEHCNCIWYFAEQSTA